MGVFGTLRRNCCNTYLMGSSNRNKNLQYFSHHKAFLPHFSATGISIHFKLNCAAVFEIFSYSSDQWEKMIRGVDALEGFTPNQKGGMLEFGYWRTLAWLHILPDDFHDPIFQNPWCRKERILDIPVEQWNSFPRVPCWIYSSIRENREALKRQQNPIIWYG